jgi:hypothetical protein
VEAPAARLLGLSKAANGHDDQAKRLLAYAEAMSRRDFPTQLWLIENNVSRGDVVGSLIHYDFALRTYPEAYPLMLPVMAEAANNAAVWRPLLPLLIVRPVWWRAFLQQYIPQATSPAALYSMASRMGLAAGETADADMLGSIEQRLVTLGAYRAAADLYNRAHPDAHDALVRNGSFEQPGGSDPFDWRLTDDPDLSAERQPNPRQGDGTALFISATNGRGGDVAEQLLELKPGTYRLQATVGEVTGDKLAFPQLIVRCAGSGRDLFHRPFPVAPGQGLSWRVTIVVPANCAAQQLILHASSSFDPQKTTPWIDAITLAKEPE